MARASSSTAVRIRIRDTPRHGPFGLLPLLALEPGLPAVPGRGVLAGELDVGELGVAEREGTLTALVEVLDEGLRSIGVSIEDVADDLGPVPLDDGGVAPIVEGELDDLLEREVLADVGHPAFETHGAATYSLPVRVTPTVSTKPRTELNV